MQVDSRDCSNYHGRRELGIFGKGRTETGRIARRASEVEGKTNSNKGTDLEGLSVTQRIMSAHRKDKNRDMKRFEGPKGHTFGGSPSGLLF